MGLSVIMDAHSNVVDDFSIASDFDSFTVLISPSGEFPLTNQKGFKLEKGQNHLVGLSAVSDYADETIESLRPDVRQCYFSDENLMVTLPKNYSQASCYFECALFRYSNCPNLHFLDFY